VCLLPLANDRRRILRYSSNQGTVVVYLNLLTGKPTFEFYNTRWSNGNELDAKYYEEIWELIPIGGVVQKLRV